jgi:exopolyphosphatase/guanosine-5'-triphosphate,3'-diphosphate pyrophosphatase
MRYAALLHDCGFFVSHNSHQQHSYYLIRHSELLGFNDVEIEVIALIALYHRKGLPKDKHGAFGSLPDRERQIVRILSCFVRLSEAMDRSHLGLVNAVLLSRDPKNDEIIHMELEVTHGSDPALEQWAVQAQIDAFNKTFGVNVIMDGLEDAA